MKITNEIYKCSICFHDYQIKDVRTSCLVSHTAGTCCHFGELLISPAVKKKPSNRFLELLAKRRSNYSIGYPVSADDLTHVLVDFFDEYLEK